MEINYTNSREDIISFHMRHYKKTKVYRRINILFLVFIILIALLLIMMIMLMMSDKHLDTSGNLLFITTFIIVDLILFLFKGKYYKFVFNLRYKRTYNPEKTNTYFLPTKLTINDDYLNLFTDLDRKSFKWKLIHDVCLIDNYIFITTTARDDILIPLSCFNSSEEKNFFLTTILKYTNLQLKMSYPTNR